MNALLDNPDLGPITPLHLQPELLERLETPMLHDSEISAARHDVCASLRGLVLQEAVDLDLSLDTVDGVELGLAESLQNAWRYGGGVRRVRLGTTQSGQLYTEVQNLGLDYPKGLQHDRPGQRPLHLVSKRTGPTFADDEHGRGSGLIDFFSLDHGQYDVRIVTVPVMGTNPQRWATISRLAVWALYGEPHAASAVDLRAAA